VNNFTQPGPNTGKISSDAAGKRWGYQFSPEDLVRQIVVQQVEAINARKDIDGPTKNLLITHLTGNHQKALIDILNKNFHTGPDNQLSGPATTQH
jgi:hypothetical protein